VPPRNRTIASNAFYLAGLDTSVEYKVSIVAMDAANNSSRPSDESVATTANINHPDVPKNIVASTDQPGKIVLTWGQVTRNIESDPAQDPQSPMIRDLEGYRIVHDIAPDMPRTPENLVADERLVTDTPHPTLSDYDVVACRQYYYNVIAYDLCDYNNDSGYDAPGMAAAPFPPAPPTGITAVRVGSGVRVSWVPTGKDTAGNSAYVDTYRVYRQVVAHDETPGNCGPPMEYRGTNDRPADINTFVDDPAPIPSVGYDLVYRVQATNDCFTNAVSACSDTAIADSACSFSGKVVIAPPKAGYVASPVAVRVSVALGGDVYTGLALTFVREADGTSQVVNLPGAGPTWNYSWTQNVGGTYLIKAKVDNTGGCSGSAAIRVRVGL